MTSLEILKADTLDILFENRNKDYGAYTLRKYYNNRLGLSLALALVFTSVIFLLGQVKGRKTIIDTLHDEVIITEINTPQQKKPDQVKRQSLSSQPGARTQKFTSKTAVVDHEVSETLHLDPEAMPSDITKEGVPFGAVPEVPLTKVDVKAEADRQSEVIQREPEFPGGTKAWLDFLQKNLLPPSEMEEGEKKTVMIRFQVSTDGSVTGFQVVQSAGRMFDNEVIRVLKKMPKWKPAIQNNQAVARWFTQPVTFMGIGD